LSDEAILPRAFPKGIFFAIRDGGQHQIGAAELTDLHALPISGWLFLDLPLMTAVIPRLISAGCDLIAMIPVHSATPNPANGGGDEERRG
jgi:hypothetical protein